LRLDQRQPGHGARRRQQMPEKKMVLDILAKDIEADLAGTELDRRCAKQRARVIDNAHGFERGKIGPQTVDDAQIFKEAQGAVEQGHGTRARAQVGAPHQRDAPARLRQPERGGEPRRARAHDDDVTVIGFAHSLVFRALGGAWRGRPVVAGHGL